MITPIVLSGGSGSRLWPLSRTLYPKQFLTLCNDSSMLINTIQRLNGIEHSPPLVICNEEHRFIVAEQLRLNEISHSGIILEPVGRNTAPAIALAALHARANGDDPILLILAADHVITDEDAFRKTIAKAIPAAKADKLVTFGIVANKPETGYGYVKSGSLAENIPSTPDNIFNVDQFVEKPDYATACHYLESGDYFWNSGMFMFKASRYLDELKKFRPDIFTTCSAAMSDVIQDLDFSRISRELFSACPDDSIDYAVMEKTTDAVVIPLDAGWSDVGSWSSLWEVSEKDSNGNAFHGDVILENCSDSYLFSDHKLIAAVGIDNIVVIDTKDAVLVAAKDKVQDVKAIVEQLKKLNRPEYMTHKSSFRPWGQYDTIENSPRYNVKRITVKPGEQISTQLHHHRVEHWIIVSGTAKITNGDAKFLLSENESVYIPVGSIHTLENPGKIPLEVIEVQSGSYLGEDDVVRLDDRYGRHNYSK